MNKKLIVTVKEGANTYAVAAQLHNMGYKIGNILHVIRIISILTEEQDPDTQSIADLPDVESVDPSGKINAL